MGVVRIEGGGGEEVKLHNETVLEEEGIVGRKTKHVKSNPR